MPALLLTAQLRRRLKKPLGRLLTGSTEVIVETLRHQIRQLHPKKVICVGDAVSRLFSQHKLQADVRILDNMELRKRVHPMKLDNSSRIFFTTNRAGTIDISSWQAVSEAIKTANATIVVKGEEDLLALAAIALAPLNSFVVYGQPRVGIVLVLVDNRIRREVDSMLDSMHKG